MSESAMMGRASAFGRLGFVLRSLLRGSVALLAVQPAGVAVSATRPTVLSASAATPTVLTASSAKPYLRFSLASAGAAVPEALAAARVAIVVLLFLGRRRG